MTDTPQNTSPKFLFQQGVDCYYQYQWDKAKECFNQATFKLQ